MELFFSFLLWCVLCWWLSTRVTNMVPIERNKRLYLIKKDDIQLPPPRPMSAVKPKPNVLHELKDLIQHMQKVAVSIKSGLYEPDDQDYQALSVELFRLASDLQTFARNKANVE